MNQQFRKTGILKDGTRVVLRPMVKEDRDKLIDFFLAGFRSGSSVLAQ